MTTEVLPTDYIAKYTELIQGFARKSDSKRFCAFAPLRGNDWREGDVIFYGRALNQWVQSSEFAPNEIDVLRTAREIADEICHAGHSQSICKLDEELLCPPVDDCEDGQMHWVHHPRKKEKGRYKTVDAGSSFWRVVGEVIRMFSERSAGKNWASSVAWSNLYKIAPKDGGNPNDSEKDRQLDLCKSLLKEELTFWKPKAVVFLTETKRRSANFIFDRIDDDWFGKFGKDQSLFTFTSRMMKK